MKEEKNKMDEVMEHKIDDEMLENVAGGEMSESEIPEEWKYEGNSKPFRGALSSIKKPSSKK